MRASPRLRLEVVPLAEFAGLWGGGTSFWRSTRAAIPSRLMMETAKRLGMVLIAPIYEVDGTGIYYNAASVIDADGSHLGNHLPAGFKDHPGLQQIA